MEGEHTQSNLSERNSLGTSSALLFISSSSDHCPTGTFSTICLAESRKFDNVKSIRIPMKNGILYRVVFLGACIPSTSVLLPRENEKHGTYNNPMNRRTTNTPRDSLKPLLNIYH